MDTMMEILIRDKKNNREIIIASFQKSNKRNFMENLANAVFKFLRGKAGGLIDEEERKVLYWTFFPHLKNHNPFERI